MRAPRFIYVHGLWMNGAEGVMLRSRLRSQFGLLSSALRYQSVQQPLAQIIEALKREIDASESPRVHLVGHSLGGVIILRTLQRYPEARVARVVMLGSPLLGSRAAQRFDRFFTGDNALGLGHPGLGRRLLGQTVAEELLESRERRWDLRQELGIIAGSMPKGLGRVLLDFGEGSDGTVAVSETRLPGATCHLTLPVAHTGLLLSARVAHETGTFLETGSFTSHD